jgi:hypothetical protein
MRFGCCFDFGTPTLELAGEGAFGSCELLEDCGEGEETLLGAA